MGKFREALTWFFLALLTIIFLVTPLPINATANWNTQKIDSTSNAFANNIRMEFDSNGVLHVVYQNGSGAFIYASLNASKWNKQPIFPVNRSAGMALDFALDNNDKPHILFNEHFKDTQGLTYVSWSESNWTTSVIEDTFWNGNGAIALDTLGNPHIVYSENYTLKYATWTGSNWSIQIIDQIPFSYAFSLSTPYIAVDQNSLVYVLYDFPTVYPSNNQFSDNVSINLKMAILKDSIWTIQTVVSNITAFSNLVLDKNSHPHFAYSCDFNYVNNKLSSNLIYDSWTGEKWQTDNIISNALVSGCWLSIDNRSYPQIAFTESTTSSEPYSVMYGSHTGSTWNIENVSSSYCETCRLALDSSNKPYITYLSNLNEDETPPSASIQLANFASSQSPKIWQPQIIVLILVFLFAIFLTALLLNRKHRKTINQTRKA
jgi:hypothetical protein